MNILINSGYHTENPLLRIKNPKTNKADALAPASLRFDKGFWTSSIYNILHFLNYQIYVKFCKTYVNKYSVTYAYIA